jgi:glutathione S-transferase
MTNANGSKVFRFCAKKLDCPCSPARPNAQQVPRHPRVLRDHHTVKIIRQRVMTENTVITFHLARKRPKPKRARIVDGRQRTHAVHAINTLALQKQQI